MGAWATVLHCHVYVGGHVQVEKCGLLVSYWWPSPGCLAMVHYHDYTWVARFQIWQSVQRLGFYNASPVHAETHLTLRFLESSCTLFLLGDCMYSWRCAVSRSGNVIKLGQIQNKSEFRLWSSLLLSRSFSTNDAIISRNLYSNLVISFFLSRKAIIPHMFWFLIPVLCTTSNAN